jgi:hypothetical protein
MKPEEVERHYRDLIEARVQQLVTHSLVERAVQVAAEKKLESTLNEKHYNMQEYSND